MFYHDIFVIAMVLKEIFRYLKGYTEVEKTLIYAKVCALVNECPTFETLSYIGISKNSTIVVTTIFTYIKHVKTVISIEKCH